MKWTPWHIIIILLDLGNVHFADSIFARSKIIGNHKSTAPPVAATQNTLQIPMPQDMIFYVFIGVYNVTQNIVKHRRKWPSKIRQYIVSCIMFKHVFV